MDRSEADALLGWMRQTAEEANRRVTEAMRAPDFGRIVGMGADGTPTLEVDRVAEGVVFERLEDSPVQLNVVSEEADPVQVGAEHTLVLDPVDGSRNVARKIPFYCISMAVGKQSQADVELGFVRNMATGQEYWARRGNGAWLDGEQIKVRKYDPDEVIVSTQLQYEKELAARAGGRLHVRSMGASALESCLVAQGSIDAFYARKPYLRIIDVSAAALIVDEAGGQALSPDGKPFEATFDVRRRVGFVAVGDPNVLEVLA